MAAKPLRHGWHTLKDLTGQKFGRLTVILRAENTKGSGLARWLCRCICGNETVVVGPSLRFGGTQSCGCLHRERFTAAARKSRTTHGMSHTKAFRSWRAMFHRCTNPKNEKYATYGAVGITVCQRWLESFDNFLSDMGHPPSPSHTVDRIDNSRGYEPENCRWATHYEQNNNRRDNIRIIFRGEKMTLSQAMRAAGTTAKASAVRWRLQRGWSVEEALS